MLFRSIETYRPAGREEEKTVKIVDLNESDAHPYWSDDLEVLYEAATLDNTTLDELMEAIGKAFEGENAHSQAHIPELIVKHVTIVTGWAGDGIAMAVLWSMVEEKGLMLGL